MTTIKEENEELETEVIQLKSTNLKLEDILKTVNAELEKVKNERDILDVENKENKK